MWYLTSESHHPVYCVVCGTSPVSPTIQYIHQAAYVHTYIHTYVRMYMRTYIHSLAWTTNSPHSLVLHILCTHTFVYTHTCVDTFFTCTTLHTAPHRPGPSWVPTRTADDCHGPNARHADTRIHQTQRR